MAWWIVRVRPSLERRAKQELEAKGIEAWLPLEAVRVGGYRVRSMVERGKMPQPYRDYPAWAGYLFARVSDDDRPYGIENPAEVWHRIRSVDEVQGIIVNDQRPSELSDEDMSVLAGRLVCSIVHMIDDAWIIGERVYVSDGPFASFPAQVAAILGHDRLRVEVNIFGRATPVDLQTAQVAKVA